MDLESKGYRDDRLEQKYDGTPEWFEDHTAKTPNGSLIVGLCIMKMGKTLKRL